MSSIANAEVASTLRRQSHQTFDTPNRAFMVVTYKIEEGYKAAVLCVPGGESYISACGRPSLEEALYELWKASSAILGQLMAGDDVLEPAEGSVPWCGKDEEKQGPVGGKMPESDDRPASGYA